MAGRRGLTRAAGRLARPVRRAPRRPPLRSSDEMVQVSAPDGATASIRPPLGRLDDHPDLRMALLDHVRRDRRVGALLVRRGGYAVGVFEGRRLLTSKVGRAYVQGRTKAGGWSQQRYARRREQQAGQAYAEAADAAARVLLPVVGDLEAVVGGGDASGVDAVLADPRLEPLRRPAIRTGAADPGSEARCATAVRRPAARGDDHAERPGLTAVSCYRRGTSGARPPGRRCAPPQPSVRSGLECRAHR